MAGRVPCVRHQERRDRRIQVLGICLLRQWRRLPTLVLSTGREDQQKMSEFDPSKKCVVCGQEFYKKNARTKTCGRECYSKWASTHNGTYRPDVKSQPCRHCGKLMRPMKGHLYYCSSGCWRADQQRNFRLKSGAVVTRRRQCQWCGDVFAATPKHQSGKQFCSTQCQNEAIEGEGSPGWKGGRSTSERISLYSGLKYVGGKSSGEHRYFLEHRVVASDYIGRLLTENEKIIHLNNDLHDNRHQNLFVCPARDLNRILCGQWPRRSNLDDLRLGEPWDKAGFGPPPPGTHAHAIVSRMAPNTACQRCGKEFHVAPARIGRTKFCSWACRWRIPGNSDGAQNGVSELHFGR